MIAVKLGKSGEISKWERWEDYISLKTLKIKSPENFKMKITIAFMVITISLFILSACNRAKNIDNTSVNKIKTATKAKAKEAYDEHIFPLIDNKQLLTRLYDNPTFD